MKVLVAIILLPIFVFFFGEITLATEQRIPCISNDEITFILNNIEKFDFQKMKDDDIYFIIDSLDWSKLPRETFNKYLRAYGDEIFPSRREI